jgi:hypothetical protein
MWAVAVAGVSSGVSVAATASVRSSWHAATPSTDLAAAGSAVATHRGDVRGAVGSVTESY